MVHAFTQPQFTERGDPLLPPATFQKVRAISEALYEQLVKETDTSISVGWKLKNGHPTLAVLDMGIPFKAFRKQVSQPLMEGFQAACHLDGFDAYGAIDYETIAVNSKGKRDWKIYYALKFEEDREASYKANQQFIMAYKKLVPELEASYKEMRYRTRLLNQNDNDVNKTEVRLFVYALGECIVKKLNTPYNLERQRVVLFSKQLLEDLAKKNGLNGRISFPNQDLNHISFQRGSYGFEVVDENPFD